MTNIISKQLQYSFTLLKEDERIRAKGDSKSHKFIVEKTEYYFGEGFFKNKLDILDLGCGKRFHEAFLFALDGRNLTAVDKSYIVPAPSLRSYIRSLRANGLLDTAKCIQLDATGKRRLYHNMLISLQKGKYFKPTHNQINLLLDDAEKLDKISDQSFDLVVSKELFEHLKHPCEAAERIRQILMPGGVGIFNIHLFTSVTGGHNPERS